MKTIKILVFVVCVFSVSVVHGQGQIQWQDYVPNQFSISVFSPSSQPILAVSGNTSSNLPSGSTQYPGNVLLGGTASGAGDGPSGNYNGNNWSVGLYLATSESSLITDINFGTPVSTSGITITGGAGNGGYWQTSPLYATSSFPIGTQVFVGLAAWYNAAGAASYAFANAQGVPAGYVTSSNEIALGGGLTTAPTLAGTGLTSFALGGDFDVTPEPSLPNLLGLTGLFFTVKNLRKK